jgi:hypothetical protein
MPMRTSYVSAVYPHARFPERFVVDLYHGLRLYTMNAVMASLCQRSRAVKRAVLFATRDGRFGEEIVSCSLVPHEQEEVAS